ncbi:MAG: hypothetical protein NT175_13030 [Bacteroidetes bacterium]|nr:hypothetical protein [Bacteroidota bacterium]
MIIIHFVVLKKRTAKVHNYLYSEVKNQERNDFGKTDRLTGACELILLAETYSCLTLSGFLNCFTLIITTSVFKNRAAILAGAKVQHFFKKTIFDNIFAKIIRTYDLPCH